LLRDQELSKLSEEGAIATFLAKPFDLGRCREFLSSLVADEGVDS